MQKLFREIGFACLLLVLALLLVFSLFWALSIGTVKLPIREIYETVLAQFTSGEPITAPGQGPVHDIVWLLRLPRVILASLVGCGLAVCGVIMQAIVKNPLADPYTLWGALMYFLFLTIAYEGALAGVNAYDQPGVESYKKILHADLKEYIVKHK